MMRFKIPVLLLVLLAGCATPAKPRKPTISEKIKFDRTIGAELARQLDPKLAFEKEADVQAYLSGVAQRMADKNPDLHIPETKVLLVDDRGGTWSSYGLPGGRLYVSIGILKRLRFENEVAALMAIQLGHLLKEHILDYLRGVPPDEPPDPATPPPQVLEAPDNLNFFGPKGVFSFTEHQTEDSIDTAVDIMYAGGYDPRGILALFKHFQDNPTRSPYGAVTLPVLIDRARKRMDLQGPLRNPIVRTNAFETVLPHIENL